MLFNKFLCLQHLAVCREFWKFRYASNAIISIFAWFVVNQVLCIGQFVDLLLHRWAGLCSWSMLFITLIHIFNIDREELRFSQLLRGNDYKFYCLFVTVSWTPKLCIVVFVAMINPVSLYVMTKTQVIVFYVVGKMRNGLVLRKDCTVVL